VSAGPTSSGINNLGRGAELWRRARVVRALVSIYTVHNPRKLTDVDGLMDEWEGEEEELLQRVRDKYIGTTSIT
jgi:hypothetical protein